MSECKALYSDYCDTGYETITTATGTVEYDLWCPCYDHNDNSATCDATAQFSNTTVTSSAVANYIGATDSESAEETTPTDPVVPPEYPANETVTISGRLTYAGPLADCKIELTIELTEPVPVFLTDGQQLLVINESQRAQSFEPVSSSDGMFTLTYEYNTSFSQANDHTYDLNVFSRDEVQSVSCIDAFTGKRLGVIIAGITEEGYIEVMGNPGTVLAKILASGPVDGLETAVTYVKKFLDVDDGILHFMGFDYLAKAQAGSIEALRMMTSIQKMSTVLSLGTEYFANVLSLDTDTASTKVYGAMAIKMVEMYQDPGPMPPFDFENSTEVLAVLEAAYSFTFGGDDDDDGNDAASSNRRLQQLPAGMLDALSAISTVSTNVNTKVQEASDAAEAKVESGEATLDSAVTELFTETTKLAITVEEDVKGSVTQLATGATTAEALETTYTPEAIETAAAAQTIPATFTAATATLKEQGSDGVVATDPVEIPGESGSDDDTTTIVIAIVVPVVVFGIAAAAFVIYKKKKSAQAQQVQGSGEMASV